MTADPDARESIGRVREGDVTALAALYDRHETAVHSLACRIVRNSADAEDVVQEVFLQLWQQASRFDNTRAASRPWLLMITRSRALDRLRQAYNRQHREEGIAQVDDHASRERDGVVSLRPLPP